MRNVMSTQWMYSTTKIGKSHEGNVGTMEGIILSFRGMHEKDGLHSVRTVNSWKQMSIVERAWSVAVFIASVTKQSREELCVSTSQTALKARARQGSPRPSTLVIMLVEMDILSGFSDPWHAQKTAFNLHRPPQFQLRWQLGWIPIAPSFGFRQY